MNQQGKLKFDTEEEDRQKRLLTGHLVQSSGESPVFLFQANKSSRAFDLLAVIGLHSIVKRQVILSLCPTILVAHSLGGYSHRERWSRSQ